MQKTDITSDGSSKNIEAILFGEDNGVDDDLFFKPITEGLGFHDHEGEKLFLRREKVERKIQIPTCVVPKKSFVSVDTTEVSLDKGDLGVFYGASTSTTIQDTQIDIAPVKEKNNSSLQSESVVMTKQFSAWFIDLFLIFAMEVVCFASFYFLSGIKWEMFVNILNQPELWVLQIIFYLLYFTFMDKGRSSSVGKKLVGITLISTRSDSVTIFQSFYRSLVIVLSSCTLWLPLLLDFQGKLTDTKIVEKQ